jgi:CHAD domain-containing protein
VSTAKSTPRSILAGLLKQLAAELQGVARSPDDAAAVHDLRVAIRRFSQALRIFPDVFGRGPTKKIRRKLKKAMSTLGSVRNLDISLEVLQTAKANPSPGLLEDIQHRKRSAQKDLAVELRSWRKGDVLAGWKTMLYGGAAGAKSLQEARMQLPDLAGKFLKAGTVAARRKVPYHQLHRCRLLGKRLRYTFEMLGTEMFGPKEFRRRLNMLKELQDHLGGLNDCVTVIELIKGYGTAKKQIRVMLAQREKAFRSFWRRTFEAEARPWEFDSLQPRKENNGTVSTPSRRRRAS